MPFDRIDVDDDLAGGVGVWKRQDVCWRVDATVFAVKPAGKMVAAEEKGERVGMAENRQKRTP